MHNTDEIVKNERRIYMKKWRAANKDKVRESNRRYWEKKALARKAAEKEAD